MNKKNLLKMMAGSVLLSMALLVNTVSLAEAADTSITVSTVDQFIAAIGDDTEILLEPGQYNLSQSQRLKKLSTAYESPEKGCYNYYGSLIIRGYKNLTISGTTGKYEAELVTEDEYSPILDFHKCENITLNNISAGHINIKGHCEGSVLNVRGSNNVQITNSDLYGCGTYGVVAVGSNNITVSDSVIRECTYGIVSSINSTNMKLVRTNFKDINTKLELFGNDSFSNVKAQIELVDCKFTNVRGEINTLSFDMASSGGKELQ